MKKTFLTIIILAFFSVNLAMAQETTKEKDDEIIEVVFLYQDGKAMRQTVKTGIQDNMFIIILEGLEEGQEIITGPYRAVSKRLKDGDDVLVVDKEDLFKEE